MTIHEDQIDRFGGLHGVRDENALESAIAAAQNVYHYGSGDVYEVAAAYAFHLAESQAYFDGNKRTGVEAAFVFLEGCGIDASRLPEDQTYDLMIKIAAHEAGRSDFADYLRSELAHEKTPDVGPRRPIFRRLRRSPRSDRRSVSRSLRRSHWRAKRRLR